eukprot:scaffold108217_cov31-Prasinocladus_malaysianus.AAC.1
MMLNRFQTELFDIEVKRGNVQENIRHLLRKVMTKEAMQSNHKQIWKLYHLAIAFTGQNWPNAPPMEVYCTKYQIIAVMGSTLGSTSARIGARSRRPIRMAVTVPPPNPPRNVVQNPSSQR